MNIDAILTALLIPFAGTALGSAFVFFMKNEIPGWLQKALLGFASGVIPETAEGKHSNLGTIGFALGFALMMVLDVVMG